MWQFYAINSFFDVVSGQLFRRRCSKHRKKHEATLKRNGAKYSNTVPPTWHLSLPRGSRTRRALPASVAIKEQCKAQGESDLVPWIQVLTKT
jgi:hypothetical protein